MARAIAQNLEHWRHSAQAATYRAKQLAHRLGISEWQLRRCTRTLFGLSPLHWLNEERLTRAPAALSEHHLVKAVGLELGFKQASRFSRAFKERYGVSPAEYLARIGGYSPAMNEIQENSTHPVLLTASEPRASVGRAKSGVDWEI
jgi:AraC-like DNA-binding protein